LEVSQAATATARKILVRREQDQQRVKHQTLLDYLFEQPLVSINMVQERLGCGFPTASKYIEQFVEEGILRETTGQLRNRRYRYDPYLALFESPEVTPFTQVEGTVGDDQKTKKT
jgi:Fic family protein